MKKRHFLLILLVFILPFISHAANVFYSELEPEKREMVVYVGAYDWGGAVEKIVVNCGFTVSPRAVKKDDFEVSRIIYPVGVRAGISRGELKIKDAYLSDSKGSRIEKPSEYITVTFDIHPEAENLSPFFGFNPGGHIQEFFGYEVENDEIDIEIRKVKGYVNKTASLFKRDESSYTFKEGELPPEKDGTPSKEKKITTEYCFFMPQGSSESEKVPLIIWFHGIGETGKSPYLALFGTKTTALAQEKIQRYFGKGAAVLVPQSPLAWMETIDKSKYGARFWSPVDKNIVNDTLGEKIFDAGEKVASSFSRIFYKATGTKTDIKINRRTPNENISKDNEAFAAVSFYTKPVKKLIDDFLSSHPEIDRSRIYIGGCSAGGYMTMNMMIQYPQLFAAGFPICEYYLDSKITDEQIRNISQKPMWFTYAKTDRTVNPSKNTLATLRRLIENGAKNVELSEFDSVTDTSGNYFKSPDDDDDDDDEEDEDEGEEENDDDEEEEDDDDDDDEKDSSENPSHLRTDKGQLSQTKELLPYEYNGHSSWIYVFNDECVRKSDGKKLFEWLSEQKLR